MTYRKLLICFMLLCCCPVVVLSGNPQAVTFILPVHFMTPNGGQTEVPKGTYIVDGMKDSLRLMPAGVRDKRAAILVAASDRSHTLKLSTTVADLLPDKGNVNLRHLVLLRPDGTGLEAIGAIGGKSERLGYFEGKFLESEDFRESQKIGEAER